MMNKNKICTILYFTAGICFFLSAILSFNNNGLKGGSLTNFALGITFTCLGVVWYKQWKKETDKDDNEK